MVGHILIIDDSIAQTKVFRAALENHGYQVSVACNGQEGIDVAKACMPDVILMDVVMPLLNGFQATRQLSKNKATSHIPIIVCSSKSGSTDRLWALRQGAKEYLVKPVNVQGLLDAVKQQLNKANGYEQPL